MTIEELVKLLNASLKTTLTPLQDMVLRSSWEGRTYTSMASEVHYGAEHLRKTASGMWLLLSDFWGEPITKTNCRAILEPRSLTKVQRQLIEEDQRPPAAAFLEFPSGPVWLNSRFYVSRPPLEALAYLELIEPGSVIRIKGPRKMGKTSLKLRILAHAAALGYRTASLDFQQADKTVFSSLNKFLRWFCAVVSRELQLESRLEDYWDEEIGSKLSCTIYFQDYLLKKLDNPLVLALSKLDLILEYPEIAEEFLPLLRSWHEKAKLVEVWRKLRLVVAHSGEIYALKLNQSPFNIGLPLKLMSFNLEQVRDLAQRHGLLWTDSVVKRLMAMVGGQPYLVRLALYYLCRNEVTLEELLQKAPTKTGIYKDHLQELLVTLQKEPELGAAFKAVIDVRESVKLEPITAYKLNNLGLVDLDSDRCTPSCELYRLYFASQQLAVGDRQLLEQENHNLQELVNIDSLTQLPNRSYFDVYLKQEWQRLAEAEKPLALIMCDLDFFRIYNKTFGRQAADSCLRQIAHAIRKCVKGSSDLVARYGGEEFAVLLSGAEAADVLKTAQQIRESVEDLRIAHDIFRIGGLPAAVVTISLGVASTIPAPEKSSEKLLVHAAEEALHRAKRQGRNQVFVMPTLSFSLPDLILDNQTIHNS